MKLCNDNVLVDYGLRDGIEFGVLCPYHYFGCFDDVDYSNIRRNGLQYDVRDLERALIIPERDAAIISKWIDKAEGKPTLAFCCSHIHARRVSESFKAADISCEVYLADTSQDDRAELRSRLRTGDLKILCVVDILNEGIDLPFIECLMFLRPTDSKRIFLQQMGRGLRWFVGERLLHNNRLYWEFSECLQDCRASGIGAARRGTVAF